MDLQLKPEIQQGNDIAPGTKFAVAAPEIKVL